MRVTAIEEYGIRCLLQLANAGGRAVLPASLVAKKEGISVRYASKFLHLLRKEGIVSSVRGLQGGFKLEIAPDQLSVKRIFKALNGDQEQEDICAKFSGDRHECVHRSSCSIRPVWSVLNLYFDNVLQSLTLADLMAGEQQSMERVQNLASEQSEKLILKFKQKSEVSDEIVARN